MAANDATSPIQLLEKARVEGRSGLYRWLYENHDELAPTLNGDRPPWAALARAVRDSGKWDGKPDGPSRQAVRGAWKRVTGDKAKAPRTTKPHGSPIQPTRETTTNVQHNRGAGFNYSPAVKVDPDEWGPKK